MFWNETTSLMRPAWQPFWGNHGADLKPAYSYNMMRSLCTLLDGAKPDRVSFGPVAPVEKLEKYSFSQPGGKKLLALWIREKSRKNRFDDYAGVVADVEVFAAGPRRVIGIDLMNGREQELKFAAAGSRFVLPGLVLKDYPLLVRLEY
jgi:hypothetical protein